MLQQEEDVPVQAHARCTSGCCAPPASGCPNRHCALLTITSAGKSMTSSDSGAVITRAPQTSLFRQHHASCLQISFTWPGQDVGEGVVMIRVDQQIWE